MLQAREKPAFAPSAREHEIWGTTLFDGRAAQRGYALNKMCYSFNDAANRAAFLRDEDEYCARYGLDAAQRDAVRRRDVLAMIAAGGNIYYLAKLAGIFGLNVQDVGAQQTGRSVEEFREFLRAAGD
jgi:protocatechuate 4,5-dioxygenase alpha chain